MRRYKRLILFALALAFALGAFQVVRMVNRPAEVVQEAAAPAPAAPPQRYLHAAKDIPSGSFVNPKSLDWRPLPDGAELPKEALAEGSLALTDLAGAVVRRGLRQGQLVLPASLARPGEQGFLAAVLDPGMRAVSVPINAMTGVAGLVFPGDRVDLILTHALTRPDDPDLPDRRASETVAEDLRVLAIDQRVSDQSETPEVGSIATLEVTPTEAERVMLATELGTLSLSLRSLEAEAGPAEDAPVALAQAADPLETEVRDQGTLPDPQRARRHTWDSDISAVLPPPADKNELVTRIQVHRGSESLERVFAR